MDQQASVPCTPTPQEPGASQQTNQYNNQQIPQPSPSMISEHSQSLVYSNPKTQSISCELVAQENVTEMEIDDGDFDDGNREFCGKLDGKKYTSRTRSMSKLTAIINATIFTGEQILQSHTILTQDKKIVKIGIDLEKSPQFKQYPCTQIIDLSGYSVAPGFIDIQINGGKNLYFSSNPNQAALYDLYQACLEFATPYCLPTLVSSNWQTVMDAIREVAEFRQKFSGVLGLHLEGPFLNVKKCGAHNKSLLHSPTTPQLLQLLALNITNIIKLLTLAPQCLTQPQLQLLLSSNIILSIGHSDITYSQAMHYFSKGIKLVTHLFNAMNQMGHRECGLVGAVFDSQDVYAPVILDGGHCHYAAARVASKVKGDRFMLVTDSSFLGREKLEFQLEGRQFKMVDGFYRDENGNLAGAGISMPEAMRNAVQNLGVSIKQGVQMCTSRVAKSIKMQKQIGYIKQGYPSKLTIFNKSLEKFKALMIQ